MKNNKRRATLFPKQKDALKILGENIKLARKRRKLTQKLVSERTGLSRVTLGKIERGEGSVSIGHYQVVLGVLNLVTSDSRSSGSILIAGILCFLQAVRKVL